MRKISATSVTLATAAAVGLAAPTSAEPVSLDQSVGGMYTMHFPDGSFPDMTFKVTSCSIGCATVNFSNATGQAQYYADRWHVSFPPTPDAWRCADGSLHRGADHFSWSGATGAGEMVVVRTEAACGYSDHTSEPIAHHFNLTKSSSEAGQPGVLAPGTW